MGQYLIDTNVITDYFSGAFSAKAMFFLADVIDKVPNLSVITKIEALSWRNPSIAKEKILQNFIRNANIIALLDSIVNECIQIRRDCKAKTPDAIIAATAIVYNFTLITSDSGFNRIANISNLNILNPYEIL